MSPERRSVIDIGTNSVKLLVADVADGGAEPVLECSEQTRLGRGFYETHLLQGAAVAHTARVVARFALQARESGASPPRVIATSAARDARNPEQLLLAVHRVCGLSVEIITGEREADWAFVGVRSDRRLSDAPLLILDVGGGSTELILGDGAARLFSQSFPLGTVRMIEQLKPGDAPGPDDLGRSLVFVRDYLTACVAPAVAPVWASLSHEKPQLVGTGGTASVLAALELGLTSFDRVRIESVALTWTQVRAQVERLWGLPLAERRKLPGLPPDRADVILTGAVIYDAVLSHFDLPTLRVSTRGMRFGALLDAAPMTLRTCPVGE